MLLAPAGSGLKDHLDQLCCDRGLAVDARLYFFACGLAQRTTGIEGLAQSGTKPASVATTAQRREVNSQQAIVWVAAILCLASAVAAAVFRNI